MQWILSATEQPPDWFIQSVKKYAPTNSQGIYAAQLLWQRGIKEESQLASFINYKTYQPASQE